MTDQNNAAQAAEQDPLSDAIFILTEEADSLSECHTRTPDDWTGEPEAKARYDHILAVVDALSKLRAEGVQAGDERAADDTLTQVYDRFGIGVLARNPSTLMACLGNVIRRANCLSQVEQVLSVPTPPEPEDDGVWGEESLLRWGADEKGYAEHFKAALAEWSRRAALASAPVAGEAQQRVAYTDSCGHLHWTNGRKILTSLYAAPQASKAVCSCPTGDGSLRHPCTVHPPGEKDGGDCAKGAGDEEDAFEAWLYLGQTEFEPSDLNKDAINLAQLAYSAGRAALSPTQPTEQGERDE